MPSDCGALAGGLTRSYDADNVEKNVPPDGSKAVVGGLVKDPVQYRLPRELEFSTLRSFIQG